MGDDSGCGREAARRCPTCGSHWCFLHQTAWACDVHGHTGRREYTCRRCEDPASRQWTEQQNQLSWSACTVRLRQAPAPLPPTFWTVFGEWVRGNIPAGTRTVKSWSGVRYTVHGWNVSFSGEGNDFFLWDDGGWRSQPFDGHSTRAWLATGTPLAAGPEVTGSSIAGATFTARAAW